MPEAHNPDFSSSFIRTLVETASLPVIAHHVENYQMSDYKRSEIINRMVRIVDYQDPYYIVTLGVDYVQQFPNRLKVKYRDRYQHVSFDVYNCDTVMSIITKAYGYSFPVYIISDYHDDQLSQSAFMSQCLASRKVKTEYVRVRSLTDLRKALSSIAKKPEGMLLSYVESVRDVEFNRDLSSVEVNTLIKTMNKRHVDIAFDRHSDNLSVAILPAIVFHDVPSLRVYRPLIFVNVPRLKGLRAYLVYKNLFTDLSGTLEQ